jgi:hypothetical protein
MLCRDWHAKAGNFSRSSMIRFHSKRDILPAPSGSVWRRTAIWCKSDRREHGHFDATDHRIRLAGPSVDELQTLWWQACEGDALLERR